MKKWLEEGKLFIESGRDTIMNAKSPKLKIHKLWPEAYMPEYGSDWAACFDLKVSIRKAEVIKYYTAKNVKAHNFVNQTQEGKPCITVYRGERHLIPTGLVFDLDETQSMRVHPRSGLSVKNGVTLVNCEGVIDADYTQQTYITVLNVSDTPFVITDGMRLAQAEIVSNRRVSFEVAEDAPETKTNRVGGFGSTGV